MQIVESMLPFGALVRREFLTLLRRRSAWAGVALIVGIAITAVATASGMAFPREIANMIFSMGITWGYGISLLIVPTIAGVSISTERQRDTLDLLLLTLARGRTVILAKILSAVGFFVLICIAVLPVFGVVFFYVGVDTTQFLQATGLLAASTLAHACLGIAATTGQRSTIRSIVRALGLAVLYSAGLFFAFCVIFSRAILNFDFQTGRQIEQYLPMFMPGVMLSMIMTTGLSSWASFAVAIVYQLAVALLGALYASATFAWHARRPPALAPAKKGRTVRSAKVRGIPDWRNPVYIKEVRHGGLAHSAISFLPWLRIWHIVAAISFGITVYGLRSGGFRTYEMWPLIAGWATILAVFAPAVGAAGMVRERQASTFVLLSTSLVSPNEIVFGHVLAGVRGLMVIMAAAVGGILLTTFFGTWPQEGLAAECIALGIVGLQFLILSSLGVLAGCLANSTVRALVFAMVLGLIYLALPELLALFVQFLLYGFDFWNHPPSTQTEGVLSALRPAIYYLKSWYQRDSAPMACFAYHAFAWLPITFLAAWVLEHGPRWRARFPRLFGADL